MKNYRVDTLIELTVRNYNKRKVVIWGKCDDGHDISQALYEQCGIVTEYYIDTNTNLVDGTTVRPIQDICNKCEEVYVVVPLRYHESIVKQLQYFGYKSEEDYAYHFHPPVFATRDKFNDGLYSDDYGNTISGDIGNVKIVFLGFNSSITMIGSANIDDSVEIYVEDDVTFRVGNNFILNKNTKWKLLEGSVLTVGDNCKFMQDGELTCGKNAKIMVGDHSIFGERYWIVAHRSTSIYIGRDCLFSRDIMLRTNDGHSIFDLHTGRNINSSLNEQCNKSIIIGEHVWIGTKTSCLYGAKINSGSVVGAHTLVKKEYPNNCIIAGVPAKIIKRDIVWTKENNLDSIENVNKEYVRYTEYTN